MSNLNIAAEVENYRRELDGFIDTHSLPIQWFEHQVYLSNLSGGPYSPHDHVAFKAYNKDDYAELIERFTPLSQDITETYINERRIAAARLLAQNAFKMTLEKSEQPGYAGWAELIEAKPGDQGAEPPRLDHVEIYMPQGLIPVKNVLSRRGINFLNENNRSHSWLSVIIDGGDMELKFTDRKLEDIVKSDLEADRARIL